MIAPPQIFPALQTARLILRETVEADAAAIYAIFSDPAVTRHYNLQTFTNVEEARQLVQRRRKRFETGHSIRWGIALKDGAQLIGSCGLIFDAEHPKAELGYEIASTHWNKGYAGEALHAVLAYAFETLAPQQIVAHVMPGNDASKHLLLKLGFVSEGVIAKAGFWNEQHHDLERFARERDQ